VALRHDPDCEVVGLAYKGLKKLTKSLATAEKKITQVTNRMPADENILHR
jgi:hypothetical protein